jgi:hypothetical protein
MWLAIAVNRCVPTSPSPAATASDSPEGRVMEVFANQQIDDGTTSL